MWNSLLDYIQNTDAQIVKMINPDQWSISVGINQIISDNEKALALWIPCLILLMACYQRNKIMLINSFCVWLSFILARDMAIDLKALFARPRPFMTYPEIVQYSQVWNDSFPSGHTSEAFAVALACCVIFSQSWIRWPLLCWALAVAFSRIYLGVHYPSDILGGVMVAALSAFFCCKILWPCLVQQLSCVSDRHRK